MELYLNAPSTDRDDEEIPSHMYPRHAAFDEIVVNHADPDAHVIKTADQDGRKVFINVCHSTQVRPSHGSSNALLPVLAAVLRASARRAGADGEDP